MGVGIIEALKLSNKYHFIGVETPEDTTKENFLELVKNHQPVAIIYNWHPSTMPWLTEDITHRVQNEIPNIKQGGLVHDVPPPFSDFVAIIHPDPTYKEHGICYSTRRLIPKWNKTTKTELTNESIVIGSFGFGLTGKGFQRLIRQTATEFPTAKLRLHIPYSYYSDTDGAIAKRLSQECRLIAGDRVNLEITHEYKSRDEMISWLDQNTINCFFYDEARDRGISSVIDFALAVDRPIAITYSWMFRHIRDTKPSICIENSTLKEIISNGTKPLETFKSQFTEQGICQDYERIVDSMQKPVQIDLTPNRVLSPQDRKALEPVVQDLTVLEPDIMSRKFPLAVFQNAFNFEQVRSTIKDTDSVILIGGYEDPIGPALQRLGYHVEISDPMIDGRGLNEVWNESYMTGKKWDIVISCSVLEHVEDDYLFLMQIYQILKPGGMAYLTTDFNDTWQLGKPKPKTDVRFYTPTRLRQIAQIFPQGTFVDGYGWSPIQPYFHYENSSYGFCSITMKNVATEQQSDWIHKKILYRLSYNSHVSISLISDIQETKSKIEEFSQNMRFSLKDKENHIQLLERTIDMLQTQNNHTQQELVKYHDMTMGIGARTLKWSLAIARRISRLRQSIKSLFKRNPRTL
jgi:SAM-dependent methyltransferase